MNLASPVDSNRVDGATKKGRKRVEQEEKKDDRLDAPKTYMNTNNAHQEEIRKNDHRTRPET